MRYCRVKEMITIKVSYEVAQVPWANASKKIIKATLSSMFNQVINFEVSASRYSKKDIWADMDVMVEHIAQVETIVDWLPKPYDERSWYRYSIWSNKRRER